MTITPHKLEFFMLGTTIQQAEMIEDPDDEWVRREEVSPKWTKEPPTVPGKFYWAARDNWGFRKCEEVVFVRHRSLKDNTICAIDVDGELHDLSYYDWWSDGPIPQPEEEPTKSTMPHTPTRKDAGPSGPSRESNDYA
jgi:hypothetical protein